MIKAIGLDRWRSYDWSQHFRTVPIPDVDLRDRTVGVVGGGVAGLVIAHELSRRGALVTIFERSGRLGGRVHSHRFSKNCWGELGAMRIPHAHAAVWDYVEEFGLTTRSFRNVSTQSHYYFKGHRGTFMLNGRRGSEEETTALRRAFPCISASLAASDVVDPLTLLWQHLLGDLLSNAEPDDVGNFLSTGQLGSSLEHLAHSPILEYVASRDSPITVDDWAYLSRLLGIAAYDRCTVLQLMTDMFPVLTGEPKEVVGGFSTLTDRLEDSVRPDHRRLRTTVVRVAVTPSGVVFDVADASGRRSERFDFAALTMSPADLPACNVTLADEPSWHRLPEVSMGPLAKSVALCRTPFWLDHDEESHAGGLAATDLPLNQCWLPAVGVKDHPDRREIADNGGIVATLSYRWTEKAKDFADLSEHQRDRQAIEQTAEVFGLAVGVVEYEIEAIEHVMWPAGYTILRPPFDENGRYPPLRDAAGCPRVLFAGEHAGPCRGWVVSAVIPAQRAAAAVASWVGSNPEEPTRR